MAIALSDLPDDVAEVVAPFEQAQDDAMAAGLARVAEAIVQRREEAQQARVSSGIEQLWKECEEAYTGIDDANRWEFNEARWSKPMSMDGPVSTDKRPRETNTRSTVFVRLTSRYVDAGAAKLAEVLLPVDGQPFTFEPTLDPDLVKARDDTSQVVHDGLGNTPLMRAPKQGEAVPTGPAPGMPMMAAPAAAAPQGSPSSPVQAGAASGPSMPPASGAAPAAGPAGAAAPALPLTVKDLAEEKIEFATKKAKAAEKTISGWMQKCQRNSEVRKVIFDAARIGVGVLKGPFPVVKRDMATTKGNGGKGDIDIQIREVLRPASKRVDPWNIFPDPACGESIQNGDYCFERDFLSPRQLGDLRDLPGYIGEEIDQLLIEGPGQCNVTSDGTLKPADEIKKNSKNRFEVWYYYGSLKRDEYQCLCQEGNGYKKPSGNQDDDDVSDQVFALITLVNDRAIRATINPLDTGQFPYHSFPWQRREGNWAGVGVAEQIKTPQRVVNASTRAMLNNAGVAAGGQIVIDRASIRPADGNWSITPNKIWYKGTESAAAVPVDDAFHVYEIPAVTNDLMVIVKYGMEIAEESTSIPLVTQGQSGATTPDTYGATQLQDNNANQLLRSIGYSFDDYITEPEIRLYYEWLLLDPEVDDDQKGDFEINAKGSAALVERAIMDQTIQQMGQMAANPIYNIDPSKWAKQYLKSKHLNPEDFQYTEAEQEQKAQQPPPLAPVVQAAQIAASVQRDALVMKQQAGQQSIQSEQQIAAAANALDGQKLDNDHREALTDATVRLHEIQMRHQTEMLAYANARHISLDQAQADLAKTAMTLRTQTQLNAADNAVDLAKEHGRRRDRQGAHPQRPNATNAVQPPGQTPGRAGNGRAFEQAPS